MTKAKIQNKHFSRKQLQALIVLFLILSTLLVYWRVLKFDFVNYDDDLYIMDNPHVQDGLTVESIAWAFTTTQAGNWHPLTWLSHMLDNQIYGLNPGRHHLTNLMFHIANTLLLFFLFKKMTGQLWPSAFIAALFALHPLHVESVAWISERKDVLSTFFWMLTMWRYICFVRQGAIYNYMLVLLCYTLGLMAKPMLVSLPFVLLLTDYYPLNRLQLSNGRTTSQNWTMVSGLVLEKIPLFVLAIIASVITFFVQKHGGAVASLDMMPLQYRVMNALISYVSYILKMIYPFNLAVFYPQAETLAWWKVIGACLLILTISFLAIKTIKKSPFFIVGWLWYLVTLVPVIGLIQVGSQSMADRYTYVPFIGLFLIITWGSSQIINRMDHAKIILPLLAAVTLLTLMTVTFIQVGYWKNSITLFEHALAVSNDNWLIHNNLASTLQEKGRIDEAIEHYQEAVRIKPKYARAHSNLGSVLHEQGQIDEAIKHYQEALRVKPDYVKVHNNLGMALQGQGQIDDAIKHYKEAVRIRPDYVEAHTNLGNALQEKGQINAAIKHYKKVVHIKPNFGEAHNNLGVALHRKGQIDAAIKHFEEALRLKPDLAEEHNNLGFALHRLGRLDDAIRHYQEALRIKPDFVDAHNHLGNALQEQNRLDAAIKHYLEALSIKPNLADTHNNLAIALYNLGDTKRAMDHFRKALQINPNHIDANNNLQKVLMLQKRKQ